MTETTIIKDLAGNDIKILATIIEVRGDSYLLEYVGADGQKRRGEVEKGRTSG